MSSFDKKTNTHTCKRHELEKIVKLENMVCAKKNSFKLIYVAENHKVQEIRIEVLSFCGLWNQILVQRSFILQLAFVDLVFLGLATAYRNRKDFSIYIQIVCPNNTIYTSVSMYISTFRTAPKVKLYLY